MEPENIYPRNAFSGPVASGKDMDRIFKLLKRMHIWQCKCCSELFPSATNTIDASVTNIFGACPDCFINSEDIDSIINLPCDHDIYVTYSAWLRHGHIFDHFGPYGNRNKMQGPPLQYELLHVLVSIVGEDRMKEIISTHATHTGPLARAFFNPDAVFWHKDYGFIPVSHRSSSYPDPKDHKAWDAMRRTAYTYFNTTPA